MTRFAMKKLLVFTLAVTAAALGSVLVPRSTEAHPLKTHLRDANITGQEVQDRDLDKVVSRLYRTALRFYDEASYWKAARELITILDYYPAYREIDGVLIYLGESLYQMQMYDSASRMFRYVATKYPKSVYLAQALHGLQRLYYQTAEVEESLKIYTGIVARFPNDETIDGVYYYGGLAYYQKHDYDNAIVVLSKVRSSSQYFDFGLYTTGLAFLKKKASPSRLMPFANC